MYEKYYTIKEIARELNISREYLHKCIKPFKYMFQSNMSNPVRKTKYSEEERKLVIKFYHLSKHISNQL